MMKIRKRYVKEMELQLPEKDVEEEIRQFLENGGFYPTVWKGENCFCADYDSLNGANLHNGEHYKRVYFFKYAYTNGVLRMEAWVRDGKNAETGITGMYNILWKRPYLNRITLFEAGLMDKLPADSKLRRENQESVDKLSKYNKKVRKAGYVFDAVSILVFLWICYTLLVRFGIL